VSTLNNNTSYIQFESPSAVSQNCTQPNVQAQFWLSIQFTKTRVD